MSACISIHGEYGEHEVDAEFTCTLCGVLDEDAMRAELRKARALRDRLEALAESWRYKGEFGWGPWQAGEGPDLEGQVLDECASQLRAVLSGELGEPARPTGGSQGQGRDEETGR